MYHNMLDIFDCILALNRYNNLDVTNLGVVPPIEHRVSMMELLDIPDNSVSLGFYNM